MKMINNNYSIQDTTLNIDGVDIFFAFKIDEVVEAFNMLIVLIESPRSTLFNENVFGVSLSEKAIVWQIKKLAYGKDVHCPFVGIKFNNEQLYLNNWCDIYLIVDPMTGYIIERSLPTKR